MRSPIPDMIERFHQMSPEEQRCFLDLVDPQPEPQPEKSSTKKKSSKKATGSKSTRASNMAATLNRNLAQQRKPMCVACGNEPDHLDHGTGEGQHEFSTEIGTRIVEQLKHYEPKCAFEVDGKVCHGTENDGIHDSTMGYAAYHEFQPEQTKAAGGD